jgi:hypothetical protein
MEGDLPGLLTVEAVDSGLQDFRLDIDAGGHELSARGHLLSADWTVKFFGWTTPSDPRTQSAAWDRLARGPSLDELRVQSIDFDWALGGPSRQVPSDYFGTVARATFPLPAGFWKVHTVSDDGIRVWIDDQLVIDDWTWHPPTENSAAVRLQSGQHTVRIEHFEIDGYARLAFSIEPAGDK